MQKIIVANWKMNPETQKEAKNLFVSILKMVNKKQKTKIVICPPVVYLNLFSKILKLGRQKISLGSQNIFWEESGAYTGEISPQMIYDSGSRYVILGHSERRMRGEKNEDINKKVKSALATGLIPIVCIGEEKRDEDHNYLNLVKRDIEECFSGISKNSVSDIIVAYEPVWAIGKGALPATATEFREMNIFIKKILSDKFGNKAVSGIKILYGGSVDEKNVQEFITEGEADGFLIGRAGLNPKKFEKILKTLN